QNVIERALALGNGRVIDVDDLPAALRAPQSQTGTTSLPADALAATHLEHLERITIQRVFEQVNGDKALAGRMLGISRATLYRKLKRYNIGMGSPSGASSSSHTLQ